MTTEENIQNATNQLPPLREEVERELRVRAWKDEAFRQELITNPKGVIERLFPQCFPDGKVPDKVTYKVIVEDPYTHHIVLPALPDQFMTPDTPEELQLELIANMGCADITYQQATGPSICCTIGFGYPCRNEQISTPSKLKAGSEIKKAQHGIDSVINIIKPGDILKR